jgi:hypothetical protein
MNNSSANLIDENSKQKEGDISLNDCLKLFTKEEEINDIECEKCQKKNIIQKNISNRKITSIFSDSTKKI